MSRSYTEGLGVLTQPATLRSLMRPNDAQHSAQLLFGASMDAALAQVVMAGEAACTKCQVCHDIGEGARNKLGPALNGLDGRKVGTVEGYDYSEANKNSGIVSSEASFKEYIEDPAGKIPGTKIMFPSKNEQEIADLWAYLKQFGTDGKKK